MGTTNSPPVGITGQTYTFAALPATGFPVGTQIYTSDAGMCTLGSTGWVVGTPSTNLTATRSRRLANIANYLKGPLIPSPAWAATTAYVVNQVVTVAGGQHMICSTAGTSGSSIPVYGIAALTGRPMTDGTVTWYGLPIIATATDPTAPTLTTGANAAALGLAQTVTVLGNNLAQNPAAKITGMGANLWGFAFAVGGYFAATGTVSGGNATTLATNAGQSNAYVYNTYEFDWEFYVTDSYFGLCMANINTPVIIEVDGVLVTPNGTQASGTSAFTFGFNYNGVVKRRLVRVMCGGFSNLVQGIALSPVGFLEFTDTPADVLLTLGDSINFTVVAGTTGSSIIHAFNGYLKRYLGLSAVWDAAVGGSGYVSQNANTFNVPAILANPTNRANFVALNPAHVLINAGCNDAGQVVGTVTAAALGSWQALRALLPNAKITVMDGFPNATGPGANNLTLAAALLVTFEAWGDPNSRFIQATTASASTAWTQGTNNAGNALAVGNSCNFVSTDGTHPTPMGAWYYGYRGAQAIIAAWNGDY